MDLDDALCELNAAQRQAATTQDGPLLVIAGAGTGKTQTLTHRLAYLVSRGIHPASILLLTFTRRAAQEMIERAVTLLGPQCRRISGGTFHSFANLTLRQYGAVIGIERSFTILDRSDVFELLSKLRKQVTEETRKKRLPRRETIAEILGKSVNGELGIGETIDQHYPHLAKHRCEVETILERYADEKIANQLLDFDDLLTFLIRLLEESPQVRQRLHRLYPYMMVDEYQDTNRLQARIVDLLTNEDKNVMVVGDDAQSIYAFRGACYENLFNFERRFKDAQLIRLEQNYRSTQPILDLSNALLTQMTKRFRKELFTEQAGGAVPTIFSTDNEQVQASVVGGMIEQLLKHDVAPSEIAVIFRASYHAFRLELELERKQIPYVKFGGFKFVDTAHIKDVMAHLRVVHNRGDVVSLARILQLFEGVGPATAGKIQAAACSGAQLATGLYRYPASGALRKQLHALGDLLDKVAALKPGDALAAVIDYYEPILKRLYDDWPKRKKDLNTLQGMCEGHNDLQSLLTALTLEPPSTSSRDQLTDEEKAVNVVLTTMHSAKGLEWDNVFVIQAFDGAIPMVRMDHWDDADLRQRMDEERRLLYVAVTRARKSLALFYPRYADRNGPASLSRFLAKLPNSVVNVERIQQNQGWRRSKPKRKRSYEF